MQTAVKAEIGGERISGQGSQSAPGTDCHIVPGCQAGQWLRQPAVGTEPPMQLDDDAASFVPVFPFIELAGPGTSCGDIEIAGRAIAQRSEQHGGSIPVRRCDDYIQIATMPSAKISVQLMRQHGTLEERNPDFAVFKGFGEMEGFGRQRQANARLRRCLCGEGLPRPVRHGDLKIGQHVVGKTRDPVPTDHLQGIRPIVDGSGGMPDRSVGGIAPCAGARESQPEARMIQIGQDARRDIDESLFAGGCHRRPAGTQRRINRQTYGTFGRLRNVRLMIGRVGPGR